MCDGVQGMSLIRRYEANEGQEAEVIQSGMGRGEGWYGRSGK